MPPPPPLDPTRSEKAAMTETMLEGTSQHAIFLLDAKGRILSWNPGVEHILGYRSDEWVGRNASLIFTPEDRAAKVPEREMEKARTAGYADDIRWHLKKDGTRFFADGFLTPLYAGNTEDDLIGYGKVLRDATQRKQNEDRLRDSERRFRALVDASSQIVWTNSPEGRMEGEQPGWAAFTGQALEAYQGYGWAEAVHPEDRRPTIAEWNRCVRLRIPFVWEHRVRRYDGVYRTFSIRAVPVLSETGTEIREWVGIHTDATEQREREQRQQFLAELTERTRGLLDPREIQWETVCTVGKFLQLDRYLYADIDQQADTVTVSRDFLAADVDGLFSVKGVWPLAPWGGILDDLRAGRTVVNRDYQTEPRTASDRETPCQEAAIRANVIVPLFRDGEWVAVFSAQMAFTPRDWTAEEQELLETVAQQMWLTLENARLFRETRARAEREALINQIGDGIRQSLPPDEIEAIAVAALGRALTADRCYLFTADAAHDTLIIAPREWCAAGALSIAGQYRLSDMGIDVDAVFAQGNTLVINHVQGDAERLSDENAAANQDYGVSSLINVPFYEGGRFVGALGVAMARGPRHWTPEEVALAETVAGQLRSTLEAARLQQRERTIAAQLQSALTPPVPPSPPGLELASYYRPALDEAGVGGDFFDVFAVDKGQTALVVADLSGKGLAAAQQVATVRNMLRFALYNARTVAEGATALHRALVKHELLSGFVTLFVGVYNHAQRTLTYVNGGQEPGLIRRAATGEVELLLPTGPVLGSFGAGDYAQKSVSLFPEDVIALFTDGLTDIGPSRRELLGINGVSGLLRAACASAAAATNPPPNQTPQAVVQFLMAGVDSFAYGGTRDDIALLIGIVNDKANGVETRGQAA